MRTPNPIRPGLQAVRRLPASTLVLFITLPLVVAPPSARAGEGGGEAEVQAVAADTLWPAARRHVKLIDGRYCKLTSRLTRIVELNITYGFGHQGGKAIIASGLDRMAAAYGGITVRHIRQGTDGATGAQPDFTLDDLLSGQVIVANNVSKFGNPSLGGAKQEAIRTAIETEGRGYLGFHGSGDNDHPNWAWFNNTLFPLRFKGHGTRSLVPVYKHLEEAGHIVLQGILESNTLTAPVPDETDAAGNEIIAPDVPIRMVKNEPFRFGRDISRDPAYAENVTILLKYDPRNLGSTLEPQYRRTGGNLYSWLYQVGAGMTSYFPGGHENDELLDRNSGFDGGVGDFDRYVAQTLFFLAGYDTTSCDASCDGLPLVDEKNRLTGPVSLAGPGADVASPGIVFEAGRPAFSLPAGNRYEARLLDIRGRVVESRRGTGAESHAFNTKGLPSGVYVLRVKVGSHPAQTRRYIL